MMKQFLTQFLAVLCVTLSVLCYFIGYNEGWQSRADEYAHKERMVRMAFERARDGMVGNQQIAFKLMAEDSIIKEKHLLVGRLLREADSLKNCK